MGASSVREMLAPGAYAVLGPLIVGFTVGPKCLMGLLAGSIVSGAMIAIMMSNAGGAWDNSKKLCEKLQIKKSEQGKACVIGDTVGDPFKDTSGPALNILIKLMSMVSLLIAPFLKGKDDWDGWYVGLIPFIIFVVVTGILIKMEILSWKDPLSALQAQAADESNEPEKPGLVKVLDEQSGAQDSGSASVSKKTSGKKKGQGKNCWPIGC